MCYPGFPSISFLSVQLNCRRYSSCLGLRPHSNDFSKCCNTDLDLGICQVC
ncbi:hypothetical protein Hanom_Chr09g00820441 [Helianthus anomalus]